MSVTQEKTKIEEVIEQEINQIYKDYLNITQKERKLQQLLMVAEGLKTFVSESNQEKVTRWVHWDKTKAQLFIADHELRDDLKKLVEELKDVLDTNFYVKIATEKTVIDVDKFFEEHGYKKYRDDDDIIYEKEMSIDGIIITLRFQRPIPDP